MCQVGRAGRDGQEAQCHLFLDDADFRRLHSLSNSDSVAASAVSTFLEEAFQAAEDAAPPAEDDKGPESLGVAVLAAQKLSQRLDLKVEVMETLLSYLEVRVPHSCLIRRKLLLISITSKCPSELLHLA